MRITLLFIAMITFFALGAAPARADHNLLVASESAETTAPERSSLDVDLKLGWNSFRLGARVFGDQGYRGGAWVNGETRADGFSVDGRVERDGTGKAWNFKLNADIDEALRRAASVFGVWRSPFTR
jgi:hypothetical protein